MTLSGRRALLPVSSSSLLISFSLSTARLVSWSMYSCQCQRVSGKRTHNKKKKKKKKKTQAHLGLAEDEHGGRFLCFEQRDRVPQAVQLVLLVLPAFALELVVVGTLLTVVLTVFFFFCACVFCNGCFFV